MEVQSTSFAGVERGGAGGARRLGSSPTARSQSSQQRVPLSSSPSISASSNSRNSPRAARALSSGSSLSSSPHSRVALVPGSALHSTISTTAASTAANTTATPTRSTATPTPTPNRYPTNNNASPVHSGVGKQSRVTSSSTPRSPAPKSATLSPAIGTREPRRLSTTTSPQDRSQARIYYNRNSPGFSPGPRRNSTRMSTPKQDPGKSAQFLQQQQVVESPPKRPRTDSGVKLLPPLYQHCDTADLVVLISDMLGELVALNDQIPLHTGGLTRFHSRAPPAISIPDYLRRLTLHSSLQPSILLSMVYYIDVLSTLYPTFTISSLTVHRFLITAATVASKGLCDSFLTNSFYAKVGGVSLMELNLLELEFLTRVGWRIVPRGEVLGEYYKSLVGRLAARYEIDERMMGMTYVGGSGAARAYVGRTGVAVMAGEIVSEEDRRVMGGCGSGESVGAAGGGESGVSVATEPAEKLGVPPRVGQQGKTSQGEEEGKEQEEQDGSPQTASSSSTISTSSEERDDREQVHDPPPVEAEQRHGS